jgi:hypothetical protein
VNGTSAVQLDASRAAYLISRLKAAIWVAVNHLPNEPPFDEVGGELEQRQKEKIEGQRGNEGDEGWNARRAALLPFLH